MQKFAHMDIQDSYRELIRDLANEEPLHGFTDITDLPEFDRADYEVILRANPALVEQLRTVALDDAVPTVQRYLLEAVQAECEIRNERRAEARDQDYYESGPPSLQQQYEDAYLLKRSLR